MKRIYFSISTALFFLWSTLTLNAQSNNDAVLMTVGTEKVTVGEFLNIYKKNNFKEGAALDRKSLEEYLDLYSIFRLKVREAKDSGLDTTRAFRDELAGYRKTLAQPYMNDTSAVNGLIREAYQRMKWDVRTSHILAKMEADEDTAEAYLRISIIREFLKTGKVNAPNLKKYEGMVKTNLKISKTSSPRDTMAAYNKIHPMRELMKLKSKDFASVAKIVSEHASKTNGGDLGYLTGLSQGFPYEYETAAFNTKQGEISNPFRTNLGYHLVSVTDKRAHREIKVAHLMMLFKKGMTKEDSLKMKGKADSIAMAIQKGSSFEDMVRKFSEHKETIKKGGELGWIGPGANYPVEFKDAAFGLKGNGQVSSAVQTRFGWHIIKRLEERELAPFDSMKTDLKSKVMKDARMSVAKEVLIGKVKKQYKFSEQMPKTYSELYAVIDSSLWLGQWKATRAAALNKPVFTILDKTYTQQDFAMYIEKNYRNAGKGNSKKMTDAIYKAWVDETCLGLRESRLEQEYPEFRMLMNEYSDGILLFNLTDQKVWTKAIKDTTGAKAYHEKNKEKFMWEERLDATIYTCKDEKTAEKVRKMLKSNKSDKEIAAAMNKDTLITVSIEGKTLWLKGDNAMLDATNWTPGITASQTVKNKVVFANIRKIVKATPKTYTEARGLVTSEYQSWLEKEWIASLKAKYPVSIDRKVFDSIK